MSEFFKQRKELKKEVQIWFDNFITDNTILDLSSLDDSEIAQRIYRESIPTFTSRDARIFLGEQAFPAIRFIISSGVCNKNNITKEMYVANMLAYLLTIEIVNEEYMDKINQMIHDYQQEEEEVMA